LQERIDVSGNPVNQYFGINVDSASGTTTNDGIFVDSIEFHTFDNLQDAVSEVTVTYEDENQDEQTVTSAMVNGIADFNTVGAYVPVNGTTDIIVSANVSNVSNSAAAPGTPVKLLMSNFEFEAQGASSNELRTGNIPVASNYHRIARNAPFVTKDDDLSKSIGTGTKGLYRFTVEEQKKESGYSVAMKQFAFDITSSGPTLDQFRILQDGSDLVSGGEATIVDSGGNDLTGTANNIVSDTVYVQFVNEATINDVSEFELQAFINGAVSGQSISTSLLNDSANANVNTPVGVAGCVIDDTTATIPGGADDVSYDIDGDCDGSADTVGVDSTANFIWSDWSKAGGGIHDDTVGSSSADWLDGVFVENLDTIVSHSLQD
jgi:hypothetical protein